MKRLFSILLISYLLLTSLLLILRMQSCAHIKADQRQELTGLMINRYYQFSKLNLSGNFFSYREVAIGATASEEDAVVRSNNNPDPAKPKTKSRDSDAIPVDWFLVPGSVRRIKVLRFTFCPQERST